MTEDIIVVNNPGGEKEPESDFEKLAKRIGGGSALADIYDQMTWIEYLFDISGSMSSSIMKYSEVEQYDWTDDILKAAGRELTQLQKEARENDDDDHPALEYDADDEQAVKQAVVDQVVSTPLPPKKKDAGAFGKLSKIQIARQCAKGFLEKRYQKYPDAKVGVVVFGTGAQEVVAGADKQTTLDTLDSYLNYANDGSTQTHQALQSTLSKVRKARGAAHHFILVTDGQATDVSSYGESAERSFDDLIQPCRDRNVVLDVIFILTRGYGESKNPPVKALEHLAEATGGTVEYVDNEQDMQQKFLKAQERKLLGTGGA